jgi:hypothetical protein
MSERCEGCKFYARGAPYIDTAGAVIDHDGDCHRHAPRLAIVSCGRTAAVTRYPQTVASGYCGDFKPNDAAT